MPSVSKKQARFMQAVAHSPSFAKKAGVPQSVGKEFSAADKGKRFVGGGRAALQRINQPDTQHGSMDMPFKSLKKFTGKKAGGKVRRFNGEESSLVSEDTRDRARAWAKEQADNEVLDEAGGVSRLKRNTETGELYDPNPTPAPRPAPKATPRPISRASQGDVRRFEASRPAEAKATPSGVNNAGAVTGRVARESKYMPSDAVKAERGERGAEMIAMGASALPIGRGLAALRTGMRGAETASKAAMDKVAQRTAQSRFNRGESNPRGWENMSLEQKARMGGYKKGGTVKDSKEMMAKEVAFMKKKGAPKSMLRHEQAEMKGMSSSMQKKMNMGGMARYAKGGGIESHGKTKGTMIRMASGGYVRSADGIATKGKTKGKVC